MLDVDVHELAGQRGIAREDDDVVSAGAAAQALPIRFAGAFTEDFQPLTDQFLGRGMSALINNGEEVLVAPVLGRLVELPGHLRSRRVLPRRISENKCV